MSFIDVDYMSPELIANTFDQMRFDEYGREFEECKGEKFQCKTIEYCLFVNKAGFFVINLFKEVNGKILPPIHYNFTRYEVKDGRFYMYDRNYCVGSIACVN